VLEKEFTLIENNPKSILKSRSGILCPSDILKMEGQLLVPRRATQSREI